MTDLEMTRLCAEAMGYEIDYSPDNGGGVGNTGFDMDGAAVLDWHNGVKFNPLHNDAQAMALVKKMGLSIRNPDLWEVWKPLHKTAYGDNADINRAIVECVAKMQQSKTKAVANG